MRDLRGFLAAAISWISSCEPMQTSVRFGFLVAMGTCEGFGRPDRLGRMVCSSIAGTRSTALRKDAARPVVVSKPAPRRRA